MVEYADSVLFLLPFIPHLPSLSVLPSLQMTCPISTDQLGLLRLLSAEARQVFTLHSSNTNVEFLGAEGEAFTTQQITRDKVRVQMPL